MGYSSDAHDRDSIFGVQQISFNENIPFVFYNGSSMNFTEANASISDYLGNLIFYSNAVDVFDANGYLLTNGNGITPGYLEDYRGEYGSRIRQGIIALPNIDGSWGIFAMAMTKVINVDFYEDRIMYALAKYNGSIEDYELVTKRDTLIFDLFAPGYLTATKHANGRDWWIVVPQHESNCYFIIHYEDGTPKVQDLQCIGNSWDKKDWLGEAKFSPDGTRYARYNGRANDLDILDFNRCVGTFSNPIHVEIKDELDSLNSSAGLSISPNNRFIYLSSYKQLYQLDLEATDVSESLETIASFSEAGINNHFYMHTNGPDGKTYVKGLSSFEPEGRKLSIIHEPNNKGLACEFEFGGLQLLTLNSWSMPNYPNYRLGPLDGSPCDTLGIDNIPIADFRWQDLGQLTVDFRNLSHHEPDEHFWDFGDGNTSTIIRPEHTYADTGKYHVCLTVSNEYGEDTFCRDVSMMDTSVSINPELESNDIVEMYPNPSRDFVVFKFKKSYKHSIQLYDSMGQSVLSRTTEALNYQMSVQSLLPGIYIVQIQNDNSIIQTLKLIVQ